tara:strand:- start:162 stop:521 length:360 start_codon:yes stop_codon:yes gene_type:complete
MKTTTEEQATKNTTLDEVVQKDSELKAWLVDYVGINSEESVHDDKVTVQMIVDTMAKEFPEFLMAVAEENWIRGYHQALYDVESHHAQRLIDEEQPLSDKQWIDAYNKHHEATKDKDND